MKTAIILSLFFITFSIREVDINKFYKVLSSESIEDIDNFINELEQQEPLSINNAYKGTLLAKKAGFEKNVVSKVKIFKAGVQLLEIEIEKFPKQTEFRFLRLSIQENCPKILNYDNNITEDVELILNNFSRQSKNLKKIIFSYAEKSKVLDANLLK